MRGFEPPCPQLGLRFLWQGAAPGRMLGGPRHWGDHQTPHRNPRVPSELFDLLEHHVGEG